MKFIILVLTFLSMNVCEAARLNSNSIHPEEEIALIDQAFSQSKFIDHDYVLGQARFVQQLETENIYSKTQTAYIIQTTFTDGDYYSALFRALPGKISPLYIWDVNLLLEITMNSHNPEVFRNIQEILKKHKLLNLKVTSSSLFAVIDVGVFEDKETIKNTVNLLNDSYSEMIKLKSSGY